MKKIVLLTLILLGLSIGSHAQGINFFHGTYADARAEAAKEHKLIFMDCFTTWCGPCNRMARDVFPRKDVGDFYNAHFICCKMDMEKGEGLEIAKEFAVKSYPTYLFLDADGDLEHRTLGSKEPALFIEDGKTAIDPEKNLHGLTEKFNKGDKDIALLTHLMSVSSGVDNTLCEKVLVAYWDAIPENKIIESQNWDVFVNYEDNMHSKAFKYIVNHKDEFVKKYGAEKVDNALYSKAAAEIRTAANAKDKALFTKATEFVKPCKDKDINVSAGLNTLRYYMKTNDWKEYVSYSEDFLDKYGDNQEIYNSVAWEMVANTSDSLTLIHALAYINKSMRLNMNYGNSDTWANILYKLKWYKQAESAADESIALAKKERMDFTSTQELLDKVKRELASAGK